jgi:penicillin-binding protein 1A
MLSVESTKLLKDIGEELKTATPLAAQKVASAE